MSRARCGRCGPSIRDPYYRNRCLNCGAPLRPTLAERLVTLLRRVLRLSWSLPD